MPGLALTSTWAPEAAPRLYYCSVTATGAVVQVAAQGCTGAMEQAAQQAAAIAEPDWKFHTSMRWSGDVRWRVCTLQTAQAVITMVVDWRYGSAQARAFAERIEWCDDAEADRRRLQREMTQANSRRLGMLEPVGATASCALCRAALSASAVHCAACGDVVCELCSKADGDQGPRCLDCEYCEAAGKRVLRLQPPGDSEVAKRFALKALFDERAVDGALDERGFVDFCRSACRHPLVVDRRSLERELRRLEAGTGIPLDVEALGVKFRSLKRDSVDLDAALELLVAACVPPWPPRALGDGGVVDADETADKQPAAKPPRAPARPMSRASGSWWWRSSALGASGHATRTGWGSLAALDGSARRKVWLELRDGAPRSLRYASDAAGPKKVLVYLAATRQIRRDAPCVVEFRLRSSNGGSASTTSESASPSALRRRAMETIVLRFETPAATSSWWSALCAVRRAALNESRDVVDRLLGTLDRGDYDRVATGHWLGSVSRFLVCGTECGGGASTASAASSGLCLPTSTGPFEGPERPFVTLNDRSSQRIQAASGGRSSSSRAEREKLVRKYRGVVADRGSPTPSSATSNGSSNGQPDRAGADASRPGERALVRAAETQVVDSLESDDSDSDYDEDEDGAQASLEHGDSLPERGFALAGPEVKAAFQALVKVIIRPPRATYDDRRLGARDFAIRPPRGLSALATPAIDKGATTSSFWGGNSAASKASAPPAPVVVHRDDFVVANERGLDVRYSLWTPKLGHDSTTSDDDDDDQHKPPCVIYIHGNACSRLGSLSLLRPLALGGVALCAIDCAGSGNSGGEFVSLGHFERDDVAAIVDDLRKRRLVGRIALWGRSMGASTALLYASTRDPHTAAVVADSPFSSLVDLCRELVAKARRRGGQRTAVSDRAAASAPAALPSRTHQSGPADPPAVLAGGGPRDLVLSAVTEAALALVRSSVKHRAGFDIYDVAPIGHVANMRHSATPVLFVHGSKDDFVAPSHSKLLHDAHGGDATLLLVPCDHQAARPAFAIVEALLFVYDRLAPKSSDRAKYANLLGALADDGYLGARDHQPAAGRRPAAQDHASGMDRTRQAQVESTVVSSLHLASTRI